MDVRLICPISIESALNLIPSAETLYIFGVRSGEIEQLFVFYSFFKKIQKKVVDNTKRLW